MTISPPISVVLWDCFCCLGLGLLLALALDGLAFLLPGRMGRFLLDVLGFALAAVLLYSFGAGRSGAGAPRWFHAAGLLTGVLAYVRCFAAATGSLREWLFRPVGRGFHRWKTAVQIGTRQKKTETSKKVSEEPEKQLQKKGKMLYNS